MLPYFCFNKIIIGPITVYIWGIFLALAFLLGYFLILREAKKAKIDTEIVHSLFIWLILGAVIGGRLSYVLQFPKEYFFSTF